MKNDQPNTEIFTAEFGAEDSKSKDLELVGENSLEVGLISMMESLRPRHVQEHRPMCWHGNGNRRNEYIARNRYRCPICDAHLKSKKYRGARLPAEKVDFSAFVTDFQMAKTSTCDDCTLQFYSEWVSKVNNGMITYIGPPGGSRIDQRPVVSEPKKPKVSARDSAASSKPSSDIDLENYQLQDMSVIEYFDSGKLLIPSGEKMGQVFGLLPHQRSFLDESYGSDEFYCILSMGRGGGKTTLIAGVGVAEIDTAPKRKTVLLAGVDEVIAEKIARAIEQLCKDAGIPLSRRGNEFTHKVSESKIYVLSSGTGAGLSDAPDLIIGDEVAYWRPNNKVFGRLTSAGAKKPNCKFFILSTRGDTENPDNKLEELIEGETGIRHLYSADPEKVRDDLFAEEHLLAANPGLMYGVPDKRGLDKMIRDAKKNRALQDDYKGYYLNLPTIQVEGGIPLLTEDEFLGCLVKDRADLPDWAGPPMVGVDLGGVRSMTGIVAIDPLSGRVECAGFFSDGPTLEERGTNDNLGDFYIQCAREGNLFNEGYGEGRIDEKALVAFIKGMWPDAELTCDDYQYSTLEKEATNAGLPCEKHRVGFLSAGKDIVALQDFCVSKFFKILLSKLFVRAIGSTRVVQDEHRNMKLARRKGGGGATYHSPNDVGQAFVLAAGKVARWREANEDVVKAYEEQHGRADFDYTPELTGFAPFPKEEKPEPPKKAELPQEADVESEEEEFDLSIYSPF